MTEDIESLKASAEAVKELAKTTGKAIDLGEKLGTFMARIFGGTLEQGVGIWQDKFKYKRLNNLISHIERLSIKMNEIGLEGGQLRLLSLKLGIPLLESASLEDGDYLQNLWANLTINAINLSSGVNLQRAHISTLEQMSELEAEILMTIYKNNFEEQGTYEILTAKLPDTVDIRLESRDMVSVYSESLEAAFLGKDTPKSDQLASPSFQVKLALSNLFRLQCVRMATTFGGEEFDVVHPTIFGADLYKAVSFKSAC